MKLTTKTLIGIASFAAAVVAASAQDATAKPERRGPPGGPRAERLRDAAADRLGLTDDQRALMQAIQEKERAELEALRDDSGLTREQRRDKAEDIREVYAEQRRAVLTTEQAAKMAEMRDRAKERGKGGPGGPARRRGADEQP